MASESPTMSRVGAAIPPISSAGHSLFNDTATTEIYTLSLHDALPISPLAVGPAALEQRLHGAERGRVHGELGLVEAGGELGVPRDGGVGLVAAAELEQGDGEPRV